MTMIEEDRCEDLRAEVTRLKAENDTNTALSIKLQDAIASQQAERIAEFQAELKRKDKAIRRLKMALIPFGKLTKQYPEEKVFLTCRVADCKRALRALEELRNGIL